MTFRAERVALLALVGLAACGCLLGALHPPVYRPVTDTKLQLEELVQVLCTTALALTLLFGPGLLWRLLGRRLGLAYLPLPGLALLLLGALLAWLLSTSGADPRTVLFAVFAPLLGLIGAALVAAGPEDIFDREEQRALFLCGLALGLAIGRTIWSLNPDGSLYAGSISRTFYAEPRPDSRIPYLVSELIAHGKGPYSPQAEALFSPYNFSSRGPLGGLISAPLVFLSGGKPPIENPEQAWQPFDEQGFEAFRIAMMTFSLTALLALWELVRRIGGLRAARFAIILGAATPFILDEMLFTWPKLMAAAFVLLGALAILERRPWVAGLFVGVGYLLHPSALLGLVGIGLLALWPAHGANWRRPDLRAALLLIAGVAVSLIAWRLLNGSHYDQSTFLQYFREAGYNAHPSVANWIGYRLSSLGNTLVPLMLPIFFAQDHSINVFGGQSTPVVHFFFQYWAGVPFGLAIVFFPLLLISLYKAARRWPWAFAATVAAPLLLFTVYWGSSITGMLREGMQWWVLTLLAVVALQQSDAGFPWLRSKPIRAILSLRALETLIAVVGMTVGTNFLVFHSPHRAIGDIAALLLMLGCSVTMAVAIWRMTSDPKPDARPN